MQRNPQTPNTPAMACGAFLRATRLDWQLGSSAYLANSIEQNEISQASMPAVFENSFSPGGLG